MSPTFLKSNPSPSKTYLSLDISTNHTNTVCIISCCGRDYKIKLQEQRACRTNNMNSVCVIHRNETAHLMAWYNTRLVVKDETRRRYLEVALIGSQNTVN